MSKLEVTVFDVLAQQIFKDEGRGAPFTQMVLLSDHIALMACPFRLSRHSKRLVEQLREERNELLGLLDDSRDAVCEALNGASNERAAEAYAALLDRIDATLAKLGKGGGE